MIQFEMFDGPVSVGEVLPVVELLRHFSARAAESHQQSMHFVLSMAAESLSDNLDAAASMAADDE